jgi:hypothetical protein
MFAFLEPEPEHLDLNPEGYQVKFLFSALQEAKGLVVSHAKSELLDTVVSNLLVLFVGLLAHSEFYAACSCLVICCRFGVGAQPTHPALH